MRREEIPLAERVKKAMLDSGGFTASELVEVLDAVEAAGKAPTQPPLSVSESEFIILQASSLSQGDCRLFRKALQQVEAEYRRLTCQEFNQTDGSGARPDG